MAPLAHELVPTRQQSSLSRLTHRPCDPFHPPKNGVAGLEVGLGAIFASGPILPFRHEVGEYKQERYGAIRANLNKLKVGHATGVSSRDAAKTPNRG